VAAVAAAEGKDKDRDSAVRRVCGAVGRLGWVRGSVVGCRVVECRVVAVVAVP
jgi:hypothetical protein